MARWLSWLERRPVTAEVDGSNPFRVARLKHISIGMCFFYFYCSRNVVFIMNICSNKFKKYSNCLIMHKIIFL